MKQEALLRKHRHFRGEQIDDIWAACFVRSGRNGDTERPGQSWGTRPSNDNW